MTEEVKDNGISIENKGGEGISLAAFVLPLPESNLPRAEVVTDSSGLGKNIDTAKIPTATVEKIAKENGIPNTQEPIISEEPRSCEQTHPKNRSP